MYWPETVAFQCSSCNKTQKYSNPGHHSFNLVVWKAYRDGWSLPTNGGHLCPECKNKLDKQASIPQGYGKTEVTQKRFDEIDQLPNPPVIQGDLI